MTIRMTDLAPALLALDGPGAIPGYVAPDVSWNGFACPYFTLDALNAHRETFMRWIAWDGWEEDADGTITVAGVPEESPSIRWPRGGVPEIVTDFGAEGLQDEVGEPVVTEEGVTLYTPGAFAWTWFIIRPEVGDEIDFEGATAYVMDVSDSRVAYGDGIDTTETVPMVCLAPQYAADGERSWSFLMGSLEMVDSGAFHVDIAGPVDVPGFVWPENRPAWTAGWIAEAKRRIATTPTGGTWQTTSDYVDAVVDAQNDAGPVEMAARVSARTIVGRGVEITVEDEEGMCMVVVLKGDGFQNLVESVLGA